MKKQRRKPFAIKFYGLFIIVFFVVVSFVLFKQYKTYRDYELVIDTLESEIELENAKNLDLQAELGSINSDSFIEKQARLRLGYVKPNEVIFKVEKE